MVNPRTVPKSEGCRCRLSRLARICGNPLPLERESPVHNGRRRRVARHAAAGELIDLVTGQELLELPELLEALPGRQAPRGNVRADPGVH